MEKFEKGKEFKLKVEERLNLLKKCVDDNETHYLVSWAILECLLIEIYVLFGREEEIDRYIDVLKNAKEMLVNEKSKKE